MAESASNPESMLVPVDKEDLCCPVCLEEFKEPKALPQCLHNMCKECLQKMPCGPSKRIECPVCRIKSSLPKNGVDGLPTNHFVKDMVERKPGRNEKLALDNALQCFGERIKIFSTKLVEMKKLLEAEKKELVEWDSQKVKDEITDREKSLIYTIQIHSKKLRDQVDDIVKEKLCSFDKIQLSEAFLSKTISDTNETKDQVEHTLGNSDKEVMEQQMEKILKNDLFGEVEGYNASSGAVKFVSKLPVYCTGEEVLGDLVLLKKPSEDTHIAVSPLQSQHPKPIAATRKFLK